MTVLIQVLTRGQAEIFDWVNPCADKGQAEICDWVNLRADKRTGRNM